MSQHDKIGYHAALIVHAQAKQDEQLCMKAMKSLEESDIDTESVIVLLSTMLAQLYWRSPSWEADMERTLETLRLVISLDVDDVEIELQQINKKKRNQH